MAGRTLFVDMNSFFASVEQQEQPALRGRPVIVVPLDVAGTSAIAASYEAKRLGITTGTSVRTARKLCPDVAVVAARPELYLQYNAGILDVLNQFFVEIKPLSVDEMACGISRLHTTRERETQLARDVKAAMAAQLGPVMRCSVGIAANIFLAKVAAERQKPDGLTVWDEFKPPRALWDLALLDLPGIGPRMEARLERGGIHTVRQLCEASEIELKRAWGSIVGARWYWMLRGHREVDYGAGLTEVRKSVGHSHVLPPEFRSVTGAKQILLRLFAKSLARLRRYDQVASSVQIQVVYRDGERFDSYGWQRSSRRHRHCNDDLTWIKVVRPLVESLPDAKRGFVPAQAAIRFWDLLKRRDVTLSLFGDEEATGQRLSAVQDGLNAKQGAGLELASLYGQRHEAPRRIPFGLVQ